MELIDRYFDGFFFPLLGQSPSPLNPDTGTLRDPPEDNVDSGLGRWVEKIAKIGIYFSCIRSPLNIHL